MSGFSCKSRAGARGRGRPSALASAPAHAGGAIGWANAVNQFSTEGQAVGAAAVVLGIIAVGAMLLFGISGLIGTVVMVCLGGALMANAQQVASIFGGGGGGGSIHHVLAGPAVPGGAATPPVALPLPPTRTEGGPRCPDLRRHPGEPRARAAAAPPRPAERLRGPPHHGVALPGALARLRRAPRSTCLASAGASGRLVTYYDPFAFEIVARNLRVPRRLRA